MRSSLHPGPRVGGEKLGAVTLGQWRQGRHDALHIHRHRIHRTGDQHRLGAHEIARMGHPVTTQNLGAGAAHPQNIDPLGSHRLGLINQLGIVHRGYKRLEQVGLVTIDDDVHLLLVQTTHVHPGQYR